MSLDVVPVSFADACEFVATWRRHHEPPVGHKFSIGVARDQILVGVAMVGRPVARSFDDGRTLEVTRCATDGTEHAPSMLYAAAWRAGKALGYRRLITYTQQGESGASLRAAGWTVRGPATRATRLEHAEQAAPRHGNRERPALPVGGRMTQDPLIAAARFLASQLEWARHAVDKQGQPYAVAAFAEIAQCAGRLRGLVNGPAEKRYLGPCGAPLIEIPPDVAAAQGISPANAALGLAPCDGDIYGVRGGLRGRCRTCGAEIAQDDRQAWLDGEVRNWAFRASEIEEAYGIKANLIRQWATPARGLIQIHGHDRDGRALYLLSHVLDVAATQAAKRAEAQAKRARTREEAA